MTQQHLLVEPRQYHGEGSKLLCFRGRGSTTVVEVKKSSTIAKKLRIAKFIQKWKKKFLLPLPWYYHGHGSSVISQLIWDS